MALVAVVEKGKQRNSNGILITIYLLEGSAGDFFDFLLFLDLDLSLLAAVLTVATLG